MTHKSLLRIAIQFAGLYLLARVAVELPYLATTCSRGVAFDDSPMDTQRLKVGAYLLITVGSALYLLRGAPWIHAYAEPQEDAPVAFRCKDLISFAIQILGLFFLTQAILATTSIAACLITKATHHPFSYHLLNLVWDLVLAAYLLRGAPHLARFMKIEKPEN